jgi:hypothetical protein
MKSIKHTPLMTTRMTIRNQLLEEDPVVRLIWNKVCEENNVRIVALATTNSALFHEELRKN